MRNGAVRASVRTRLASRSMEDRLFARFSFSYDPRLAEQQMHAIIFYLTAFGYIDGNYDESERTYVRNYIANLVEKRADEAQVDAETRADVVARWTEHFLEVSEEISAEIQALFTESVADGENQLKFVQAKLKLRCFELFKSCDEENRGRLLATVEELMHADGVVHPHEVAFRDELLRLIDAPLEFEEGELEEMPAPSVIVGVTQALKPRQDDHPFLRSLEWEHSRDKATFAKQAEADLALMTRVMDKLAEQNEKGKGRLANATDIGAFAGQDSFLDGHTYVVPPKPGRAYELLVLGDLHGCYSCLKAALLQADFFGKVQAFHDDPVKNPEMKLVFLGDYIDRGRFSYAGILRTAMELFLAVPDHVYLIRGNHEYYVELKGRTLAPVRPAEAYMALADVAPNEVFASYMRLFESLPNMLFFDRTLFVHAGIPRDVTVAERYKDLSSLNDPEIRFQMLWSDPSDADAIPDELQKENARFPFGRRQFKSFMNRIGATTMIRGHERIIEGFKEVYDAGDARLFTLFSAGGKNNADLPLTSNYREVTPMALTIKHQDGATTLSPFIIDYERFNDPRYNGFFQQAVSGTP
ncbi:Serine/threonine protein phosphatase catalytic subunit protein [Minicystis rosea]|nr:Serine/threonine protein phosphatase catalytic subunit protein [Minicystis rosea]